MEDVPELHRAPVEFEGQHVDTGSVTYGSSPPPSLSYGVSPNHQQVNFTTAVEENIYSGTLFSLIAVFWNVRPRKHLNSYISYQFLR